jgi:hypothetical protein
MSICYTNTVFHDLRERYPTWEQMEDYLESEEGGLFRIVDRNEEKGLYLIRYEKGITDMNHRHSKWFRSVVWDRATHSPVSIAPPKTTSLDFPFHTRQEAQEAGVVFQELLDGFMINCFKRVGDDTLYITSRSRLNASGQFYSAKSFRQLFVEAYTGWKIETSNEAELEMMIGKMYFPSPDSSKHEVAISLSFLVQHVEHRIVTTVRENSVTLIQQTTTYEDGTIAIQDTPDATFLNCARCLPLSNIPYTDGPEDATSWIHEQIRSQSWEVQGIVCKDTLGNRWRYRSDAYNAVRSLRGNTASMLDRFVQLYLQNLTHTFLQYYPEYATTFAFHQQMIQYLVKVIYEEYQQLHVRKAATIDKINKMYHPHLYAIHGYYLSQLRPNHKKVSLNDVHDYIRKQPWQRVAFLLRQIQDVYFEMIHSNHA